MGHQGINSFFVALHHVEDTFGQACLVKKLTAFSQQGLGALLSATGFEAE